MAKNDRLQFDTIGYWSELKLQIVQQYAGAYSKIFSASRQQYFKYIYVDAFAGAGFHLSRKTGEWVAGSPLNALNIDPPFHEFHLIDIDGQNMYAEKPCRRTSEYFFTYRRLQSNPYRKGILTYTV